MSYTLRIPPCGQAPAHPHHFPPLDKPLRVAVDALVPVSRKLFPDIELPAGHADQLRLLEEAGGRLAKLTFSRLYGRDPDSSRAGDFVVRLGGFRETPATDSDDGICLQVFFDHLVPPTDSEPEVLQLGIVDPQDRPANDEFSKITISEGEFKDCFVAVPLCCQKRDGPDVQAGVRASVNATVVDIGSMMDSLPSERQ
ncbi:MAG: hypothetical protein M1813_001056 [Trichoglossum hirsutum]|nr:MAG: hypothetical protein M1813_001056 [Trichoglossum hirsutum]